MATCGSEKYRGPSCVRFQTHAPRWFALGHDLGVGFDSRRHQRHLRLVDSTRKLAEFAGGTLWLQPTAWAGTAVPILKLHLAFMERLRSPLEFLPSRALVEVPRRIIYKGFLRKDLL